MIVNGAVDYEDTEEHKEELELNASQAETRDIGVVVGGVLLTIVGFIGLGLYVVVADWRCNYVCPCILSKKQGLARQLQGQSGGQIMAALNPSTDPLVSHTQYAPVSELPRPDDEECRTLMPGDNKDWLDDEMKIINGTIEPKNIFICSLSSAEESDRMLDPDPRIVLRPGRVEDA